MKGRNSLYKERESFLDCWKDKEIYMKGQNCLYFGMGYTLLGSGERSGYDMDKVQIELGNDCHQKDSLSHSLSQALL